MYDYDGDMSYFQRQLERAGIGKEEIDMCDYAGLTARELQGIVNSKIRAKKVRKEHDEEV